MDTSDELYNRLDDLRSQLATDLADELQSIVKDNLEDVGTVRWRVNYWLNQIGLGTGDDSIPEEWESTVQAIEDLEAEYEQRLEAEFEETVASLSETAVA